MTPIFRQTQNALLVETYKIVAKYTLAYGEVHGEMVERESFSTWANRVQIKLNVLVPEKYGTQFGV